MPSQSRTAWSGCSGICPDSVSRQVSLSSSLCPLSATSFPCAPPGKIWFCPLHILLSDTDITLISPDSSLLMAKQIQLSASCFHYPPLWYVHVFLSWGAQNFTCYSGCFSAVWEERMKHLLIFWLHSWMLLASFAARTADSCSPYLPVGTPSSFPANLCPSQLDSHLPAGTGLFPFRCRTSASCS